VEIELVGKLHQLPRGDSNALACGARADGTDHPVARRDARYARPNAFHDTGEFGSWGKRKRRLVLVFTVNDQRVEEIHSRRLDAHDCLAGSRGRRRDVGELEFIGSTVVGAEDRSHDGRFLVAACGKRDVVALLNHKTWTLWKWATDEDTAWGR